MARDPLVSVVLPVHDAGRFLEPALESVLAQTFGDLECVVVNDGSKDGSRDVLERFAKADPRVHVHDQQSRGVVAALNHGASLARGRYIARMDADDVAFPDRLARQVALLEQRPATALVGGGRILITASGETLGTESYPEGDAEIRAALLDGTCCFAHPAVVLRREAFRAAGGYRATFAHAEDYDLWLRLADRHELANLREPVLYYRVHAHQVSIARLEQQTVSVIGARAAALTRRAGGSDPSAGMDRISRETLAEWGISAREIDEVIVGNQLLYADLLERAGAVEPALLLLEAAAATCRRRFVSRRRAAEAHAWRAMAYARLGRPGRAALAFMGACRLQPGWVAGAAGRRVRRWL
jgi:glycosyltransferase involved in cell wall biosynthesis